MQKTLLLVLLFIPCWASAGEACRPGCGGAAGLSCYCCPAGLAGLGLADAEPLSWRPCSCCAADHSSSVPLDLDLVSPTGCFPSTTFPWPGLPCCSPLEQIQEPPLKPPRLSC